MKQLKPLLLLIMVCTAVAALMTLPASAVATTQPSGGGEALEIAPPRLELYGNPGQTIDAKLYLRDISSSPLIVNGTVDDFVAKGDSGTPQIIINSNGSDPYSLKSYVGYIPNLLLQSKELKILNIPINIPKNASPGGHYGVIRFTASPPPTSGGNRVSLSASLGALILLTVSGKLVEHLNITQFSVSQNNHQSNFFQSDPLTFSELVKNSGNIHVVPAGTLTVTDMFNKKLFVTNINRSQGNVLPSSQRLFSQQLLPENINNRIMFGRYTASVAINYGLGNRTLYANMTFWVIPVKLIAIWIAVLIIGFFLLRWLIKRYNRYILEKAKNSK